MKSRTLLLVASILALATACRNHPAENEGDGQERVVSLAPNLTEIVCAIGAADYLVGRSSACDYPPDVVKRLPIVGGFGNPSIERLLKVRPTLVLEVDMLDKALRDHIGALGIKHKTVPCHTLDDIPHAIRQVGRYLRREKPANQLASEISSRMAQMRQDLKPLGDRPSVFVEIWNEPLTTVGGRSFISGLIALAGGRNIGDNVNRENFVTSSEWVISHDPDIILCLYPLGNIPVLAQVGKRLGWHDLKAVQSGQVYGDLPLDLLLRPGPRCLDALPSLRRRITAKHLKPTESQTHIQ